MTRKAMERAAATGIDRIIAHLTPAEKRALLTAFPMSDGSGLYPRLAVRMDVRRRLQAKGLLSTRPAHPLLKKGRDVRARLLDLEVG